MVLRSTYKESIQFSRSMDCRGNQCRECNATVHRFTMSDLKVLVLSSTSLGARFAAYEQQVLLKIIPIPASYQAKKLIVTTKGNKHAQVHHLGLGISV